MKDCPCSWCRLYGDNECPRYRLEKEIEKLIKEKEKGKNESPLSKV